VSHRSCFGVVIGAVLLGGCSHRHPYTWVSQVPRDHLTTSKDAIDVGDRISVVVRNQERLSGEFDVRPDGRYVQPLLGHIEVAGLTPEQAEQSIEERLQGIVVDPDVTISVTPPAIVMISVVGEVKESGNYEIPAGDGVLSAIARAGGVTEFSRDDRIFVLREHPQRVRIRFRYRDLAGGDSHSNRFQLRDGDVIVVQ